METLAYKPDKIKKYMKGLNISQNELGRRAGLNKATISRFINGKCKDASLLSMLSIAKVLNVPITEIIDEDAGVCLFI